MNCCQGYPEERRSPEVDGHSEKGGGRRRAMGLALFLTDFAKDGLLSWNWETIKRRTLIGRMCSLAENTSETRDLVDIKEVLISERSVSGNIKGRSVRKGIIRGNGDKWVGLRTLELPHLCSG